MAEILQDVTGAGNYELFFPNAPETGGLWVQDPPSDAQGNKGTTTDTNWASTSVTYLNNYIATNGPFAGILGYSQGSMFATYYLSVAPAGTFEFAVLFCGYLPDTHIGLLNIINSNPPTTVPALVFMGANDAVITNAMTQAQAAIFPTTQLTMKTSQTAGHVVPDRSDATYNDVVQFMISRLMSAAGSTGSGFGMGSSTAGTIPITGSGSSMGSGTTYPTPTYYPPGGTPTCPAGYTDMHMTSIANGGCQEKTNQPCQRDGSLAGDGSECVAYTTSTYTGSGSGMASATATTDTTANIFSSSGNGHKNDRRKVHAVLRFTVSRKEVLECT
jgi:dienelactone hydrolase